MTSEKVSTRERRKPLSPHLQIYKPQITSLTSILHRLTGIFLYLGVLSISWIIVYYTYQVDFGIDQEMTEGCDCLWKQLLGYFIYLVLFGLLFSLYYHLFNGIRHLFWDIGKGLEIKTVKKNGFLIILIAIIASVVTMLLFI